MCFPGNKISHRNNVQNWVVVSLHKRNSCKTELHTNVVKPDILDEINGAYWEFKHFPIPNIDFPTFRAAFLSSKYHDAGFHSQPLSLPH